MLQTATATSLDCTYKGLTGPVPATIGEYTKLADLSLYGNALTGTVPAALGDLTLLTRLDLSGNQFTGTVPAALRTLTDLTYLSLNLPGSTAGTVRACACARPEGVGWGGGSSALLQVVLQRPGLRSHCGKHGEEKRHADHGRGPPGGKRGERGRMGVSTRADLAQLPT